MKIIKAIAWILVIVGGLNWGLVGFWNYNVVSAIFGDMTTASMVVYDLVGLSALYLIFASFMMKPKRQTQ